MRGPLREWILNLNGKEIDMPRTQSPYNLHHRPDSYWNHDDPLQEILAGISGTARRQMITDFWNAGKFEKLEEGLLHDDLDEQTRQRLGAFHPFFMGGEYLPKRLPYEVVIARIDLQSTTFDVIELRARPLSEGRIGLRWVDEYDGRFTPPVEIIDQPFSFAELIEFIEETGLKSEGNLPHVYNESNCYGFGLDEAQIRELEEFTSFSSNYYPELGTWAATEIAEWVEEQVAALDEE